MKGYFTSEDSNITIEANPAGVRLYNTSKNTIEDNCKQIDELIKLYREIFKLSEFGKNRQLDIDSVINKDDNIRFIEIYCNFLDTTTELSISSRELYIAKTKTEQIYYIKNIYLCLSRYIDRMNLQRQFLQPLATNYDCLSLFEDYTLALRNFKPYLKEITKNRNKIVAHFDKDMSCADYHEMTSNYDAEAICQMTIQFMDVQKLLSLLLVAIFPRLLEKLSANSAKLELQKQNSRQSLFDTIERLKGTPAYDLAKSTLSGIFEKIDMIGK